MGRFKKGLVIGGALGAGLVWLNTTKKGRDLRHQILDHAAAVSGEMKKELMASNEWKTMTQSQFAAQVKKFVDIYAVQTGLAQEARDAVERIVKKGWSRIRKELQDAAGRV